MGRRAYPGDPGASNVSTHAWQATLRKEGLYGTPTGVVDKETQDGLKEFRKKLGLGAKSRWTTVWAHAHGVKAADVVDGGPPEGSEDDEGADGA